MAISSSGVDRGHKDRKFVQLKTKSLNTTATATNAAHAKAHEQILLNVNSDEESTKGAVVFPKTASFGKRKRSSSANRAAAD